MEFKWPITIISLCGALLFVVFIRGIETFDDTTIYLSAMQEIQGKTPIYPENLYIRQVIPLLNNPAVIVLSVWLEKIFNSKLAGLALLNWAFYILAVFFFYNIAFLIFKNNGQAFIAAIFLSANYSMLRFGPGAYLVDMSGWFFYIATLYLATRFFYSQNDKFAYLAGFTSMAGLFFKEYGGIGILTLGMFILMSPRDWKSKFALTVKSGSFLFINLGYHAWAYTAKGYLYFNRYNTILTNFTPQQTVFRTIKVLGYLFNFGWPLALAGLVWGYRNNISNIPDHKKVFFGLMPPALIFLAYPAYDQRIAFVAVPLLSLLATLGINTESKKTTYIILGLYTTCNFFLIHKLSLPDR